MIYFVNAIQSLVPNAKCAVNGDCYEGIIWYDERPLPSKEAIQAEFERLQALEPARVAGENRHQAYINEADPLFFKAQRGEATMEEWQAKVAEIKARFPKEQS